jgi:two-component system, cell cycle sensor histidine kinase and response regulator CckA
VPAAPLPPVEILPLEERGSILATVEEDVGIGTYVWEPGVRVMWSHGFFRLLGMVPGPVESKVFFERVHPDDRARVAMAWQVAAAEGRVDPFEYRLVQPDGSVRYIIGRGHAIKQGGAVVRVVGTLVDVSEAHEGKERLAEALALIADTQRAAGVGSYVYELDSGKMEWSDELYRMMGLDPSSPVDAAYAGGVVHPEDAARQHAWTARMLDGEHVEPLLVRARRADGTYIHLESVSRLVDRAVGRCVVGVSTDVTARVELDHQVRHAAKMDAIGRLAAGVAHDFNNYLTVLSVELDALRRGRRTATPEDLASMADAVDRCAGLVRQLLAFSRQHPFRPQPIDLAAQVDGVVKLFSRVASPDLAIHTDLIPQLIVRADAAQIDGAVMNLLINARDAMPAGGELTIELREQVLAAGRFARLRVRDTGTGIPADVLPRIFEPYFTTKAPAGGSGLGLAAVYGTVHQHDGWIDVISNEGQGSTFDIYLPVHGDTPSRVASGSTPPAPRLRILLVEDVAEVRIALAALLEDEGHAVEEAADGAAALERVRAGESYDLVITDVVMPRLDGVSLTKMLAVEDPLTPVILMTGGSELHDAGVGAAWLDKPFSRDALLTTLARVIHRPRH